MKVLSISGEWKQLKNKKSIRRRRLFGKKKVYTEVDAQYCRESERTRGCIKYRASAALRWGGGHKRSPRP